MFSINAVLKIHEISAIHLYIISGITTKHVVVPIFSIHKEIIQLYDRHCSL